METARLLRRHSTAPCSFDARTCRLPSWLRRTPARVSHPLLCSLQTSSAAAWCRDTRELYAFSWPPCCHLLPLLQVNSRYFAFLCVTMIDVQKRCLSEGKRPFQSEKWRGSQVVRSRSAKPLFAGSIPAPACFH